MIPNLFAARSREALFLFLTGILLALVATAQTGPQGTFVGTVTDGTGAVIPGVKVTVVNTGTQFVSEVTTNPEGNYIVPYLNPGTYRITISAGGFKQYVRDGIDLRPGETPRFNATLEIGAVGDSVTVTGETPLLNTESATVSTALPQVVLQDISNVQKRIVRNLYYMPGVIGNGSQGYHILGNSQRSIGYSMDGVNAKWPGLGTFDQNDEVIQTTQDALEEVKVITSGMSADVGHAASGGLQLSFKSGANQLHGSFEDRLLRTPLVHRSYFQQEQQQPFSYDELEGTFSGPVYFPKLYNGRNRTFFLFGFAQHRENWYAESTTTVPSDAMLNGDFTFNGLGYPIYDPVTIRKSGSTWISDPMPGNLVPKNRYDPAVVKFLSYTPWVKANQPGVVTATGPSQNFLGAGVKGRVRSRWDVKVDQQISASHKIFGRYSHAHHQATGGSANPAIAWDGLDTGRIWQPTDVIQGVLSDTYLLSSTRFNDIRIGVSRRANQNIAWGTGEDWAGKLGIPGVPNTTFPQLNVGYGVSYSSPSYYVGEEFTVQDNFTQVLGTHNLKMGYELVRARYNSASGASPSGSYSFGGTSLYNTTLTGNGFASFLLGSVTSASFSQRFANWLPRWWQHALYLQDDWKVRPGLTINLGLRWSYETPYRTKYSQQSQWDPNATDPLSGMKGAILHPSGYLARSDWNNFQPRVGLSWNFARGLVFRASFGLMTQDIVGGAGSSYFQEYQGSYNINQATGDPRVKFYLSQGPGVPINYARAADGTFPYVGSSYSGRGANWLDPGLVNPYIMNWSGGIQYEFARLWLVEVRYEGSAANKVLGSWNINEIPLSITLGGNRALQDAVYPVQQNYKPWTNFGNINLQSNFNHSTYHSGSIRVERRMSRGFMLTAFHTYGKALNGADNEGGGGTTYYNRALQKGVAGYNRAQHFNAQLTYELPFGKGRRWMNTSTALDHILGGWALSVNETLDSGMPFSPGFSNSPNKYLTGTRVVPLTSVEDALTPGWKSPGPDRFPLRVPPQIPYLKFSSFAYPAAYTIGFLGRNVFEGPGMNAMGFAVRKTWSFKERYKATARLDGHNLPFKQPNFTTPSSSWSTANPQNFGSMSGTLGAWSEYGYNQATLQVGLRFEF